MTLHPNTEVKSLHGSDHLQSVTTRHNKTGAEKTWDISKLFLFLGARPAAEWLQDCIATDQHGFVLTGNDLDLPALINSGWQTARYPAFLEASKPGVYPVGDVRSGSTKRVASAVGEGSMAVQYVHRYLAGLRCLARRPPSTCLSPFLRSRRSQFCRNGEKRLFTSGSRHRHGATSGWRDAPLLRFVPAPCGYLLGEPLGVSLRQTHGDRRARTRPVSRSTAYFSQARQHVPGWCITVRRNCEAKLQEAAVS